MQLLFEASEEGPAQCLGVLPRTVCASRLHRPAGAAHGLEPAPGASARIRCSMASPPANTCISCTASPPGLCRTLASADYGAPLAAVVRHGNFWGTQFHPERSTQVGARILANFLRLT